MLHAELLKQSCSVCTDCTNIPKQNPAGQTFSPHKLYGNYAAQSRAGGGSDGGGDVRLSSLHPLPLAPSLHRGDDPDWRAEEGSNQVQVLQVVN